MMCTGKACKANAILRDDVWDITRTKHTCTFDGTQEEYHEFEKFLKELICTDLGSLKDCHDKAKAK